ncbi:tetratricopeptide repeat protein [Desulfocurvibacter africanus]|uniref:Tetratricopeptide TPR_1 repeat-containing protein n=3 Tax=Desulfocurvibacter africanus TaxID=873 RepID=F3YUD5_DESAF|nr:tetratricopeptide repeat protein [Desulfocurvibacter africanus]EGJ48817.1 Tetratricopeptide TPR_1 repeat-containing protein [Desulfocurvibacter africanus subsp. africanus str. Walvis Bay]
MRARIAICIVLAALMTACAGLGLSRSAKNEFEEGLRLYNAGEYAQAVPHFQKATQEEPEYAEAFLYLGRAYLNQGKWSQALPPLRTAWRLSPDETRDQVLDVLMDALIGAGTSAFETGNYTDALGYLREGLRTAPQDSAAWTAATEQMLNFGGQLLSKGNFTEAITLYRSLLEAAPGAQASLSAYLGLAKAYLQNGQFLDALRAATAATRVDPALNDPRQLLDSLRE